MTPRVAHVSDARHRNIALVNRYSRPCDGASFGRYRVSIRIEIAPAGYLEPASNAWAMQTRLCSTASYPTILSRTSHMRSCSLNLLAPVLQELGEPQKRLLGLVHRQVLHSLQQMGCDVLVQELPCWTTMSDRLVGPDCHWRWRD
jgi:hypothetical protein